MALPIRGDQVMAIVQADTFGRPFETLLGPQRIARVRHIIRARMRDPRWLADLSEVLGDPRCYRRKKPPPSARLCDRVPCPMPTPG
jgi:hypothetical protein